MNELVRLKIIKFKAFNIKLKIIEYLSELFFIYCNKHTFPINASHT